MSETGSIARGDPRSIRVLRFMRVIGDHADLPSSAGAIRTRDFVRHLEYLERGRFTPVTLADFRLFQAGELDLPRKPVVLCFPAGDRDFMQTAFPVMERLGVKGVLFVAAGSLSQSAHQVTMPGAGGAGFETGGSGLEAGHLVELSSAGFEIGSLGMTGTDLTTLPDDRVWAELSRSRMLLEYHLNREVRAFYYPGSGFTPGIKAMVAEAGYSNAVWGGGRKGVFGADLLEIGSLLVTGRTSGPRVVVYLNFGL
jgi:peptidoglycan/xylan/chitin deacetylase (PgdA/CDA1 family)